MNLNPLKYMLGVGFLLAFAISGALAVAAAIATFVFALFTSPRDLLVPGAGIAAGLVLSLIFWKLSCWAASYRADFDRWWNR